MENQENKDTESLNFDSRIPLDDLKEAVASLKNQLAKVIVGQNCFFDMLMWLCFFQPDHMMQNSVVILPNGGIRTRNVQNSIKSESSTCPVAV